MWFHRFTVLALGAVLTAPVALAGQMCLNPRPAPRCHSFWITEVGISKRLGSLPVFEDRESATLELGHMVNAGPRSAFGAGIFVQVADPISGFGLRPRYRRWLSPSVSIDIAPGVEYRSNESTFLPNAQLALKLAYGLSLTGDVHLVHVTTFEGQQHRKLAWYGGARIGGGFGLVGMIAVLALTAVVAATWNGY